MKRILCSIGAGIGVLVVGMYAIFLWLANLWKSHLPISSWSRYIFDPLFFGTNLASVRIVFDANGLFSGVLATTIGHTIYWRGAFYDVGRRETLLHELVHVRQYEELGYLGFSFRYVYDWLSNGFNYEQISLEVEARTFSLQHLKDIL